jgi:hypothetical protein
MKTRIFLHPGMGEGEPHYLDRTGTLEDLARSGLTLHEGMTVTFYDYDASEKFDDDKLLFEGTVLYVTEQQKWYALVDWSSFRHESDEARLES